MKDSNNSMKMKGKEESIQSKSLLRCMMRCKDSNSV